MCNCLERSGPAFVWMGGFTAIAEKSQMQTLKSWLHPVSQAALSWPWAACSPPPPRSVNHRIRESPTGSSLAGVPRVLEQQGGVGCALLSAKPPSEVSSTMVLEKSFQDRKTDNQTSDLG